MLDQLFVWDFLVVFEILAEIELLNCHIQKFERAMILTSPVNGNPN